MTDALAAHLRLLERLKDKIRTHESPLVIRKRNGEKYCGKSRHALLERLKRCEAQGMSRAQMIFECGTSSKTVVRLLGKIRFTRRDK